MTDETRAELRKGIEAVVRVASLPLLYLHCNLANDGKYPQLSVYSHTWDEPPPLTTAQQLALSVLVGDEAVLPEALADYLLDMGHEYAVACFRKGVESANPFAAAVKAMTPALSAYAEAMAELGRRMAESPSQEQPRVLVRKW